MKYISLDSVIEQLFSGNKLLLDGYILGKIQDFWLKMSDYAVSGGFPVNYKDGVLVVAAVSSVWVQELSMRQIEIFERIRSEFPEYSLKKIIFRPASDNEMSLFSQTVNKTSNKFEKRKIYPSEGSPAYKTYEKILETAKNTSTAYSSVFERIASENLNKK